VFVTINDSLRNANIVDCEARPIRGKLVLLSAVGQADLKIIVLEQWDKLGQWFEQTLARIGRIPLHVWTEEFFKDLTMRWGSFLDIDSDTRRKSCFDIARIAILTPSLEAINTMLWVKIDGESFPIIVVEEHVKAGDWSAYTREAKEGVFASPLSPSTYISAVPDLFGNFFISEQQPVVEIASEVVADFSKFQPAKEVLVNSTPIDSRPVDGTEVANGRNLVPFQDARCRSEGAGSLSKQIDLDVSKPLGWEGQPARSTPILLFGPERQKGGPLRLAHVQVFNREGVSVGPGIRLAMLKSTEEIQKEEVPMFSLSPGPPHI
ncbi:hypothetical protein Ancab_018508, partial [Ancistrocladus abbreviatus]